MRGSSYATVAWNIFWFLQAGCHSCHLSHWSLCLAMAIKADLLGVGPNDSHPTLCDRRSPSCPPIDYPDMCILLRRPFLLPCLVAAVLALLAFVSNALLLRESHPKLRRKAAAKGYAALEQQEDAGRCTPSAC